MDYSRFIQHKDTILSCLRNVPRAQQFNEERAWRAIESVARNCRAPAKGRSKGPTKLARQYRTFANSMGRALVVIERAMERPEFAAGLLDSWWEEIGQWTETGEAGFRCADWRTIHEFSQVLYNLNKLKMIANAAVKKRARGRPSGTTTLPRETIHQLAHVYLYNTLVWPGAGNGPFARFVRAFFVALGRRVEQDAIVDAIKAAKPLFKDAPRSKFLGLRRRSPKE